MKLVVHLSKDLPTTVQVLNLDGHLEIEKVIVESTTINLTALTRGIYLIRCSNLNQTTTGRILRN
ncbi:MAG: T9SS type A sorting domain-containing protein [Chitinophagaceae bacterium]|nr:T9SS type A sorting domain-containing protein [Chitinophagaceae bacterium]